ncbi:MAG: deoxyguanosinetriphosphate triphosphohydrolase [Candidatus Omnitrophica bacterium]|nr:deoxyguanosinetriphosphate triphosphohydrolase [Candidatus Omnitrophota bacterium]
MLPQTTREQQENRERETLAPYAVCSGDSLGRRHPEKEHEYRTRFQRDRDRIVHSEAFRRLEYKTQVFITGAGDHYRTRLTHTLEVSQIARTLARALSLNEDLTEALALAHDLGHPPFGHAGERILAAILKNCGGFEHNAQALRIVDWLECRYPQFPGLNLTAEMRRGILKDKTPYAGMGEGLPSIPSLEAQIVDISDEISYTSHDLDDGISAGILYPSETLHVTLWREAHEAVKQRFSSLDEKRTWYQVIIRVINDQVTDVLQESLRRLQRSGGVVQKNIAVYSESMRAKVLEAREFLFERLYRHPQVLRANSRCRMVLTGLFEYYCENVNLLPVSFQERIDAGGLERTVADYISGMTDRFALEDYRQLFSV